jgi:anti-sigma B factor antagonist
MPATPFKVAQSTQTAGKRTVHVLALSGQLDHSTFLTLQRELEGVGGGAQPSVVLNFAELEYISSAGLGVLIKMARDFRERDGDIRFAALPPRIGTVTDMFGFSQVIRIFPKVEEAVGSFASNPAPPPGAMKPKGK